jgi:hypothetical protein
MITTDELVETGGGQSTALVVPEPPSHDAYIDRLRANLAIAEQTLSAVRELEAGLAAQTSTPSRTSKTTSLALSIVIPVYNERDTIVEIVRASGGVHRGSSSTTSAPTAPAPACSGTSPTFASSCTANQKAALRQPSHCRGDVVAIQDADLE